MKTGEQVLGLSAVPPATDPVQARGELAGVSISNRLVTFERSAPGKLLLTGTKNRGYTVKFTGEMRA